MGKKKSKSPAGDGQVPKDVGSSSTTATTAPGSASTGSGSTKKKSSSSAATTSTTSTTSTAATTQSDSLSGTHPSLIICRNKYVNMTPITNGIMQFMLPHRKTHLPIYRMSSC